MDDDDLYGLAFERFVPERAALAKRLRAEGNREQAARVARLRKPSIAAWAVNQLVRTQRPSVQALFDAGDALRDAQSDLLEGHGDARALRAANERERAAVEQLMDAARGLLTSQGEDLSPTVLERVSDTLHAAALDETSRERVREGRLERELRHAGLGFGDSAGAAVRQEGPPRITGERQSPKRVGRPRQTTQRADSERPAKERVQRERVERERRTARTAARAAEAKAQRRAKTAADALLAAEQRRAAAAHALGEADDALAAARDDRAAADAELARARAELDAAARRG